MIKQLAISTPGQGLHEITTQVAAVVRQARMEEGLCSLFIRHTSASLVVQENADPTAKRDLERWLNRLVPEGDPFYRHDAEGPDDMPAHIKAALTATSLAVPCRMMSGKPAARAYARSVWIGFQMRAHSV